MSLCLILKYQESRQFEIRLGFIGEEKTGEEVVRCRSLDLMSKDIGVLLENYGYKGRGLRFEHKRIGKVIKKMLRAIPVVLGDKK